MTLSFEKNMMRYIYSILLSLTILLPLQAQKFPDQMIPKRLVNDYTGLLSEQEMLSLNNKLLEFNNQTSTQIYVVTYDDLQGYDIGDFGQRLGENWGIGQQGKNNGILVLISPAAHKITIQTGYGMEGAVPDAVASKLIERVITPGFRQQKYYASLDSATNVLMSLTRGEFTADQYVKKGSEKAPGILMVVFILIMFVFVLTSGMRKRRVYSPGHAIPWWLLLLGTGGPRSGGWGSFSSGSGGFGGGGGGFGGFGGGGGGSFGGGGASGGW
jgi:uncharacterized protein